MKKIITCFLSLFLFNWFFLNAYAIEAPTNLKVELATNNSVILSWLPAPWSFMYSVYYSKTSPISESEIYNQTDYIEETVVEISDLDLWNYYFSVVAIDESWEESVFSDEVMHSFWEKALDNNSVMLEDWENVLDNYNNTFMLESIESLSLDKIKLIFSQNIEDTDNAMREFKIVNKNDPIDIYYVQEAKIVNDNKTELILTLDRDTKEGEQYEVTVMIIKSENWQNIENWIDSTEVFISKDIEYIEPEKEETPEVFIEENYNNIAQVNNENEEEWIELLAAAENNENLPNTWPQHVFIILISIILWLWFFVLRFKKS